MKLCLFCGRDLLTGDLDGDGDPEVGECQCPSAVEYRRELAKRFPVCDYDDCEDEATWERSNGYGEVRRACRFHAEKLFGPRREVELEAATDEECV